MGGEVILFFLLGSGFAVLGLAIRRDRTAATVLGASSLAAFIALSLYHQFGAAVTAIGIVRTGARDVDDA